MNISRGYIRRIDVEPYLEWKEPLKKWDDDEFQDEMLKKSQNYNFGGKNEDQRDCKTQK